MKVALCSVLCDGPKIGTVVSGKREGERVCHYHASKLRSGARGHGEPDPIKLDDDGKRRRSR